MFYLRTIPGHLALLSAAFARIDCKSVSPIESGVSNLSEVKQTTYSYPVSNDSIIFNLPSGSPNATSILPTQIRGEIYVPSRAARNHEIPLVILLSGKHPDCRQYLDIPGFGKYPLDIGALVSPDRCLPNQTVVPGYRGFDYLGRALASEGFMAISIDPLLLNNVVGPENDPFLSAARGRLLLRTIERLRGWDADATESRSALGFDISNIVDFSQIAVLGHSRGGAGVMMAYNILMTPDQLPVKEVFYWSSALRSNITGVFEVATFDDPTQNGALNALGVPWALVGAGCESDEVDFAYLNIAGRQSRSNLRPNHFLNVYGASHEYFNSEWHAAVDDCIGDQRNTWNASAPTFPQPFQGQTVHLPEILGSASQRGTLEWSLLAFVKAYVGRNSNVKFATELTSHDKSMGEAIIEGVEIGLANPNVAVSSIVQPFIDPSVVHSNGHSGLEVESIPSHSAKQFPLFNAQVSTYGFPPTFAFQGAEAPAVLTPNATYDQGIVITIPPGSVNAPNISLSIPLCTIAVEVNSSPITIQKEDLKGSNRTCQIEIDVARRSSCYLPASHSKGNGNATGFDPEADSSSAWMSPIKHLKSRFNVEFGPYNLVSGNPANHVSLIPLAWETMAMEVPCAAFDTPSLDPSSTKSTAPELDLDILFTADAGRVEVGNSTGGGGHFLYLGPVRVTNS